MLSFMYVSSLIISLCLCMVFKGDLLHLSLVIDANHFLFTEKNSYGQLQPPERCGRKQSL